MTARFSREYGAHLHVAQEARRAEKSFSTYGGTRYEIGPATKFEEAEQDTQRGDSTVICRGGGSAVVGATASEQVRARAAIPARVADVLREAATATYANGSRAASPYAAVPKRGDTDMSCGKPSDEDRSVTARRDGQRTMSGGQAAAVHRESRTTLECARKGSAAMSPLVTDGPHREDAAGVAPGPLTHADPRVAPQLSILPLRNLQFVLPMPPSVNALYGIGKGGKKYLVIEQLRFRSVVISHVRAAMRAHDGRLPPLAGRLEMSVTLFFADRRRTDIGNREKALSDALMHAGAFHDDSQIDRQIFERVIEAGDERCDVRLREIAA